MIYSYFFEELEQVLRRFRLDPLGRYRLAREVNDLKSIEERSTRLENETERMAALSIILGIKILLQPYNMLEPSGNALRRLAREYDVLNNFGDNPLDHPRCAGWLDEAKGALRRFQSEGA